MSAGTRARKALWGERDKSYLPLSGVKESFQAFLSSAAHGEMQGPVLPVGQSEEQRRRFRHQALDFCRIVATDGGSKDISSTLRERAAHTLWRFLLLFSMK
jgi:hypothetical protein